jgi:hypothetical protein
MAQRRPQKGGPKKSNRLKSFTKLVDPPKKPYYFEPLINRHRKEILEERNRH